MGKHTTTGSTSTIQHLFGRSNSSSPARDDTDTVRRDPKRSTGNGRRRQHGLVAGSVFAATMLGAIVSPQLAGATETGSTAATTTATDSATSVSTGDAPAPTDGPTADPTGPTDNPADQPPADNPSTGTSPADPTDGSQDNGSGSTGMPAPDPQSGQSTTLVASAPPAAPQASTTGVFLNANDPNPNPGQSDTVTWFCSNGSSGLEKFGNGWDLVAPGFIPTCDNGAVGASFLVPLDAAGQHYEFGLTPVDNPSGANSVVINVVGSQNQPPKARLSVTAGSGQQSLTATADPTKSTDSDGTFTSSIDWGDGTTATADPTNVVVDHTYTKAGTYTVTLTVTDNDGATDTATKQVTVTTLPPVNHDPVANPDVAITNEGTAVTIDVLKNDTDPDGNPLTVTGTTGAAHGSITSVNGVIVYTPSSTPFNYVGTDSFGYTVSDGHGGTASSTVTITVNPTETTIDYSWVMADTLSGSSDVTYPQYLTGSPYAPTCGHRIQTDTYRYATEADRQAVYNIVKDSTLTEGEDSAVVLSWRFSDQPDCVIVVVPAAPTSTTPDCTSRDRVVTVPVTEGVEYLLDGRDVSGESITLHPGDSISIQPVAKKGYQLDKVYGPYGFSDQLDTTKCDQPPTGTINFPPVTPPVVTPPVNYSQPPTQLASTGAGEVLAELGLAGVLVVGGVAFAYAGRRRRTTA